MCFRGFVIEYFSIKGEWVSDLFGSGCVSVFVFIKGLIFDLSKMCLDI